MWLHLEMCEIESSLLKWIYVLYNLLNYIYFKLGGGGGLCQIRRKSVSQNIGKFLDGITHPSTIFKLYEVAILKSFSRLFWNMNVNFIALINE